MRRTPYAIAAAALVAAIAFACSDNLLKTTEKTDPADEATIDLEHNNPDAAISVLNSALSKSPSNAQYLSILALAYAQRAGIEPLEFATQLAEAQTSSGDTSTSTSVATALASGQDFSAEFAILPDASTSNLSDLGTAVSILTTQIPAAELQAGDPFKIAIFNSADFLLTLKSLDSSGSGVLSTSDIDSISDATASSLVALLASASSAFGANSSDATSQQAQAAVAKYQDQIAAEPGATDSDKLKAFLAANPNATSTASGTSTDTSTDLGD